MLTREDWARVIDQAMESPSLHGFVTDPKTYLFVKIKLTQYRQPSGEWGPWLVDATGKYDGRSTPIIQGVRVDEAIDILTDLDARSVIDRITRTWFYCRR